MIKKILLLVVIIAMQACSGTKVSGDKWIGESKKNLIKSWGPPIRILHTDDGEMLIYAEQVYKNGNEKKSSSEAGSNHWNYIYIYANNEGKIYSYKTDKQRTTPQEIAVK